MADRDIANVVWDERRHHIEVTYVDGESERLVGSESVAFVLAKNAGLSRVSGPDDTCQWSRVPA